MADSQENKQKEQNDVSEKKFMIEKIKERPVNKKKLLRRTLITASMAVIFGLVACFTFLVLEPVISNWLYPEEEPQVVVFPEDQDEMSPEQMLAENMQQENQSSQSSSAPSEVMEQEQIRRVIHNIISNSVKYLDKQNGFINIRVRDVGDFVQFEFEDNGRGIAAKDLPYIFERFYRVDKARSRETGGNGLGLAITRNAILLHRGSIKVHSIEQQGTTFAVRIPLMYSE